MNPTVHALSVRHHPNEQIFFEDTNITHINGCLLPEPIPSSLKLDLFPRISFRIESDRLPKKLINLQHEGFRITISGGSETKVFLRYNLNDFMSGGDTLKGYLIPAESPCAAMDPQVEVKSIDFGVLNFRKFYGRNDKWVDENGNSRRLGFIEICFAGFRMKIRECLNLSSSEQFLSQNDGYLLTHVGSIERNDGATYLAKDGRIILKVLRAFLSFLRGSACGLTFIKATTSDGNERFLEWGASHAEPWICGSETWLVNGEGGDVLSHLFPEFYELCREQNWKDTMFTVTDLYLNSSDSPFHIGIILTQAALEALSYKILQKKVKPMHRQIRKALLSLGVDENIPASCEALNCWITLVRRSSGGTHGDGPYAITTIRNTLVHANKRYGRIPAEAQIDALRLGQWYIEMILLRKLGYVGPYRNRISDSGRGSVENVPWSV